MSRRMRTRAAGNSVRSVAARSRVKQVGTFVAASALLGSGRVWAHPGHGLTGEGESVAHYALEPTHGWGLAAALAVAVVAVVYRLQRQATAAVVSR